VDAENLTVLFRKGILLILWMEKAVWLLVLLLLVAVWAALRADLC